MPEKRSSQAGGGGRRWRVLVHGLFEGRFLRFGIQTSRLVFCRLSYCTRARAVEYCERRSGQCVDFASLGSALPLPLIDQVVMSQLRLHFDIKKAFKTV